MRRKTNEEYIEECKQKGYDLPVEEYKGSHTKINHKCKKCGNIYEQKPNDHLRGVGCPYCYGNNRKTTKQYIDECNKLSYDLPVEEYKGANINIKHKCRKCDNVYEQSPSCHLQGQGCPKCRGKFKKTTQQYIEECKIKGYDIPIEPYVNSKTKINHKCSKCGNVYKQNPNKHLQGRSCPICGRKSIECAKWKTNQQYIEECKRLGIDLPIEEYKGTRVKISHKCRNGHVYKQAPYYRLHYYCGCPICIQSRGERFIQNYLSKYNISYETQKTFSNLKDKQPLSYDFYLSKQKVLIEYQGIQHFESVSFDGKVSSDLEKQQYHDKLKREYATNNGYTLLEPTYKLDTQEKVNNYLDSHLKG